MASGTVNTKTIAAILVALAGTAVLGWQVLGGRSEGPRQTAEQASRQANQDGAGSGDLAGDLSNLPDGVEVTTGPDGRKHINLPAGTALPRGLGTNATGSAVITAQPEWVRESPEPVNEPDYRPAAAAAGALKGTLLAAAQVAAPELGQMASRATQAIETVFSLIAPLIEGDEPAFAAAVEATGGMTEPGKSGATPAENLYGRLRPAFDGMYLDMANAVVRVSDPDRPDEVPGLPAGLPTGMAPKGSVMMMLAQLSYQADDGSPPRTINAMNMPLGSVFPDANDAFLKGAKTVEVRIPARLDEGGKGDAGRARDHAVSWFVTWTGAPSGDRKGGWQPVGVRVRVDSERALEAVMPSVASQLKGGGA